MDVMSSCTLLRREGTLFIFFKRNDNCIFLGIIPSFKLMVFSCRQTICFQQHLNELYSSNNFLVHTGFSQSKSGTHLIQKSEILHFPDPGRYHDTDSGNSFSSSMFGRPVQKMLWLKKHYERHFHLSSASSLKSRDYSFAKSRPAESDDKAVPHTRSRPTGYGRPC